MNNKQVKEKKNIKDIQTHKKVSLYSAVIFFILIILADIFLIFDHGKVFSENENRILAQAPKLSIVSISRRDFMSGMESFVSDQFFMRDNWIQTKLKADKLIGKKESHDVYIGKKGYLFENTTTPDIESIEENINAINDFASNNKNAHFYMSIIPNATEIYPELVPSGAPLRDQTEDINAIREKLNSDINFIDVEDSLVANKETQLYYKSDHHWTSAGAKVAFDTIARAMGLDISGQDYDILIATEDFSGTMASSSGDFNTSDVIELYIPKDLPDHYVEYSDDTSKYPTIYNSESLNNKNKYEVFTGGNHPLLKISTTNETKKNLLLLKDSYANCFLQFLIPYYDNVYVVDPRYYSDDISSVLETGNISDVLILYNENTFAADNSLSGVLIDE